MSLYDRILVPTDGSAEGERAVSHALALASVHGATVHALYVVDTAKYAGMPMETTWEGVGNLLRDDATEAVEAVERLAEGTGVAVDTAVVEGSPSREIVRYAEEHGCDLVVMGTHGRGGIDRLLLGSVAEKVVRAAAVPVMTVRIDGDVAAGTAAESGNPAEATTPDDGEPEAAGRS
ncbi:universal stress protein [Halorubrum sp. AD140]|uniref:universal stress protein n=1 Tax=Halorubrum sp. AD140 TaxID=3050073 RepID=UPI002ACCC82C|nr:universal stress protein [Halorubrum sp. AD140]MDZ5812099.1 universal stress protein [Halorubrum sp. AD140]